MLFICMPGLWIVLSSLRPTVEIMAKPPVWIPQELSFDAYVSMFSGIGKGGIPVLEYFRNSLIISITSTAIATRAVLVDLPRHFARRRRPWHPLRQPGGQRRRPRGPCLARRQGSPAAAAICCWCAPAGYRRSAQPGTMPNAPRCSPAAILGLSGDVDMWEFLWDQRVAGGGLDGVTVECWPLSEAGPACTWRSPGWGCC